MGKIVVLGASPDPTRFSHMAVRALLQHGYEVVAIGSRNGHIGDLPVIVGTPPLEEVEKIILYVNPSIQEKYYEYILSLHPQEILFNPGTENTVLAHLAIERNIEIRYDCALMLIDANVF
jgi:predicted CoA-binding protein